MTPRRTTEDELQAIAEEAVETLDAALRLLHVEFAAGAAVKLRDLAKRLDDLGCAVPEDARFWTDRKTIMDYEGEASWTNDFATLYLGEPHRDGDEWIVKDLEGHIVEALGADGADWHGRLHILVELVEGSE